MMPLKLGPLSPLRFAITAGLREISVTRHAKGILRFCQSVVLFAIRLKGRFFYRMVDDSLPQWIRTYPEEAAPRTGDGLFPGEVIEVAQVKPSLPTISSYPVAAREDVCNVPRFFSTSYIVTLCRTSWIDVAERAANSVHMEVPPLELLPLFGTGSHQQGESIPPYCERPGMDVREKPC